MKKIVLLLLTLTIIFTLTSCSGSEIKSDSNVSESQSENKYTSVKADSSQESDNNTALITLGDKIAISGSGATADGSTLNITAGGTYSISGTLNIGQININTTEKVNIELNGATITNNSGPALLVTDAKKVTLTLVAGTINSLTDAQNGSDNDAALFTNDTLVIEGEGTLIVEGNNNEGISSDDDIIINSGTIKMTSADDGFNAHDDITINGGYVYITANGDGIDSNGTININGGTVISMGSTAGGDGGIDATGTFTITGGTIIASGNSIAAPSSSSTQASLYVSNGSNQESGTLFHLDQNGSEIITFAPARSYQNVFYSSDKLTVDATYQAYIGGSYSGNDTDGLYTGGTYTNSGSGTSVTAAIIPAGAGSMGGPGGAGGPGGMRSPGGMGGPEKKRP